ncbi:hypothetical protein YC2023_017207 [Brassica napus]
MPNERNLCSNRNKINSPNLLYIPTSSPYSYLILDHLDYCSGYKDLCREKQRFAADRLQTVNRKLSAMKQVSHLVYENGHMKHNLDTVNSSP